jgi:hypothetical protein
MEGAMPDERKGFFQSRSGLVLLGFLVIAGYFLWTEHRAHAVAGLSYLPYLLLLACPLMHLFHGGHHHGGHKHDKHREDEDAP